jgi:membrane protease YdiL (CAAX protease family)
LIGTSNGKSGLGEFALIATLAFAFPLTGVVRHSEGTEFTNGGLLGLVVFELLALAATLVILRARGWSLALAPPMTFRGTATGVALWIAAYALYVAMYSLLAIVPGWDLTAASDVTVHVSVVPLLLVVFVNPVFEEVLVVGYVLTALERFGPRIAIAMSVLIRLSYHLYQGPIALSSILPMGVLFASFFWWRRRLWPLVVAHGLADLIALLAHNG